LHLSSDLTVTKKKARDCSHLVNALGSCLLFNLALAYHLHGIAKGASSAIKQAMKLYRTMSTLRPRFCRCTCSGSGIVFPMTSALLQCLVLNNLSRFHQELCAFSGSDESLDYMTSIICGTSCLENRKLLSEAEAEGIKLNLIFRKKHTLAQAA
jgi:hypothetical protein